MRSLLRKLGLGKPHRAEDVDELEKPGDPRGGLQDEEYRKAGPTDLVESEGTVMSGPGGAPQEPSEG